MTDQELKRQIVERIKRIEHPADAECVAEAIIAMIVRERKQARIDELNRLIGLEYA